MKNDKLIPGLILVLIGAAFLLCNLGYIHPHWGNVWHLWPVLIVMAGVNLVFAHNRTPWATALKIIVIVGGFALLLFGNFGKRFSMPFYTYDYHNDKDGDDNDDNDTTKAGIVKVKGNSNFNQPYAADAKEAQLNISGGATNYELSDTTNQLFKADTKEFLGKYEFSHHKNGELYVLDFKMKDHQHGNWQWNDENGKTNAATFKLNVNPIWNVRVESGATALNFDLQKFKVKSFVLKGGAGSFDVKLGQPLERTDVNVSAGASSVDITIPQSAACDIESNTGFASNSFDGFNKQDNGHYQTPGFAGAKNKMYITISGGVGSFDVHRE